MDLDKARRAMDNCEEWREMIEAACILQGVENSQGLQVKVTVAVAVAWHLVKE